MKTITVLGNNSGRNAGDNAILGNLLDDFALMRSDITFKIPTLSTSFIKKSLGHHPIQPIGLLPWNLAVKNLGWPLYRAMTKTDMVLITDNILFDRKLNNPLLNNLKSISLFAPFCKKKNIPIIFYNASVGPIDTEAGKKALQKVLDASLLVITRDTQTKNLLDDFKFNHPEIVVHADCALNTKVPSPQHLDDIIAKENLFTNPKGTIGLNVNAYIDNWSETGTMNRKNFCEIIAGTADALIENLDVDILFTVSQIMDMKITQECVQQSRHQTRIKVVGNCDYTYQELTGLLSKVDVHAGLRTHTLIFCTAVGTPSISINAYPKNAAFLKTVGLGDWTIDFEDLSIENLEAIITRAWNEREGLSAAMAPIVKGEKEKSRESVALVSNILGS